MRIITCVFAALALCPWLQAQAAENLVRNSDFERAFRESGPADGWHISRAAEGGVSAIGRGEGMEGGACHYVSVPPSAEVGWYGCAQTLDGTVVGVPYVASVYARVRDVRDGSGAYFGVNYFGADGRRLSWTDSDRKLTGATDWTRIVQPFELPPGTVRAELVFSLHGHGEAWFDRAQVEGGTAVTVYALRQGERNRATGTGERRRIAVYQDDIPPTGTPSDPGHLVDLARAAGYDADLLDTTALSDPARLDASRYSVVVLPYGASFPAEAADAFRAFLRDGGGFFAFGGYPFDRLLARQRGLWTDVAELTPDESRLTTLVDLGQGAAGWSIGGKAVARHPGELVDDPSGPCLELATESLDGWVSLTSPTLGPLPTGSQVTAFYARADEDDTWISFEWDEQDGSRWRTKFRLTQEWRLYAVGHNALEYWHDNPSTGRGGPEDRFRPDRAAYLSFGLTGEFLRTGRSYAVYVNRIAVGADPLPPYRNLQLNSHFGTLNPATFLETEPGCLSVCDASAPLSGVAYLAPSPGQTVLRDAFRVEGACSGVSATGQTAAGGAGAALKARWVPILDARDRYGRIRGTGLAVMQHFGGDYPGSSWAYSGIDSLDLFPRADPRAAGLFAAVLRRLAAGAFLFEAQARYACMRPGEDAEPTVSIGNVSDEDRDMFLHLSVRAGERIVAEQETTVHVAAHRSSTATMSWVVPEGADLNLCVLDFSVGIGDEVLDRLQAGVVVWNPEVLARGSKVAYRDGMMSIGRGPEFLLGTQIYWGNSTITGTDPLRWDRQYAEMADSGIRVARSFMAMPSGPAPTDEAMWRRDDALLQLAQSHGIALFYAGVSRPTVDPAEVADRARLAGWAAERYREAPGWFIDIVNEPSLAVKQGAVGDAQFREYLTARYGGYAGLREAWGADLKETSIDEVTLQPAVGSWSGVRAADACRFMAARMRAWTAATAEAGHAVDPSRLISVGHLQGFGDQYTMWDPIESSMDLDFVNRHYYGDLTKYAPELKQSDLRTLGKAPSTGEFGATSHPGLTSHFVYQTEPEVAQRYTYTAHTAFGLGALFAANWHWQDPIEDIFPCGLLLADGAPRERFTGYRNAGMLLRSIRPAYVEPEVFFVIPTSHHNGSSKLAVEAAMNRSLEALIGLHVEFGSVPEGRLDTLPPTAKALVWPVPFCPEDEVVERVRAFVERGGALYISGDVSYDGLRRRTRQDRLRDLCGVEFVEERYPDIQYPADGLGAATAVGASALADAIAASEAGSPCIRVRPTTAVELARAGDCPAAVRNPLGRGFVVYVIDPVELHASPWAILRAFLEEAGVTRHAVEPDVAGLHSHRVHGRDGEVAQVLLNTSDEPMSVVVSDLPQPTTIRLAPKGVGLVAFDASGQVVAAEGVEVTVGGRRVLRGPATTGLADLSGGPASAGRQGLLSGGAALLLPTAAGDTEVCSSAGQSVSIGEVVAGAWSEYERTHLEGRRISLDDAAARSWLLIGSAGELPELAARIVERWL